MVGWVECGGFLVRLGRRLHGETAQGGRGGGAERRVGRRPGRTAMAGRRSMHRLIDEPFEIERQDG